MASLGEDVRAWVAETAGVVLRLLLAVGLGVLVARALSGWLAPKGAMAVLVGGALLSTAAFEVGRGYERA